MSKRWSHEELFVLLNLYQKLAFGQFDHRNSAVKALAEKLGRTPSSVAMKLSNMASFDPSLQLRGIQGLQGASRLDREVWDEFHLDLVGSMTQSEEALRNLMSASETDDVEVSASRGIFLSPRTISRTEITTERPQRIGQNIFRNAVLNNYDECCAVTNLNLRPLLVASHILPWATHPKNRLEVENGI